MSVALHPLPLFFLWSPYLESYTIMDAWCLTTEHATCAFHCPLQVRWCRLSVGLLRDFFETNRSHGRLWVWYLFPVWNETAGRQQSTIRVSRPDLLSLPVVRRLDRWKIQYESYVYAFSGSLYRLTVCSLLSAVELRCACVVLRILELSFTFISPFL